MTSYLKSKAPDKDPYAALGLTFGVTDVEISKAYRQLARTLHPDKLLTQDLSDAQRAQSAIRFQEIQTARSFLLDVDHAESRRKYDAQLASNLVRQRANQLRDNGISEKRKRMRDELKKREEEESVGINARNISRSEQSSASTSAAVKKVKLEEQGKKLREQYAVKAAVAERQESQHAAIMLQERQIRLKWSRKSLKATGSASPSEHSLAQMLTQACGEVDDVQMIGGKGNVALVTFRDEASCLKAVALFLTSEIWRATYVSKKKQTDQEQALAEARQKNMDPPNISVKNRRRDLENVHEWKERQAAEREALLRKMAFDDSGGDMPSAAFAINRAERVRPFPRPFPKEYTNQTFALNKLEKAEDDLLKDHCSDEVLRRMKSISVDDF